MGGQGHALGKEPMGQTSGETILEEASKCKGPEVVVGLCHLSPMEASGSQCS